MTPAIIVAAGVVLGLAYTLSPLTVLSLAAVAWAVHATSRDLSARERRWLGCLLSVAMVLRLAALALLFLSADETRPFASFFGDEDLYKFRTVWVRNIGQGIAISPADMIYSYDDVGRTSYMYVLAFVQAVVGDAPYGLHVLNLALYLCGSLWLYRVVRRAYGGHAAMGGLAALLFLPSLLVWSISVLKEPMNVFMLIGELMAAVAIVRAPRWWQKALAMLAVAASGVAMESLRGGGLLTAVAGTLGGLTLVYALSQGRRLVAALIVLPTAAGVLAALPPVQDRVLAQVRSAAFYHAGHVLTPGHAYQLVNPSYYWDRVQLLEAMPPVDAGRFAVTAVASYFVQPVPWRMESRTLQAYLPEQMLWYVLVLLLPFGILAGLRRDVALTSMLVAHAAAAILIVAVTSGNIGTLIRHRSLALPYLVWFAALGGLDVVRRIIERRRGRGEGSRVHGNG